jgi:tetratricopeptide (TPR) repeat protein
MYRLEVSEYAGPLAWRFQLLDATGDAVAEHRVELDPAVWEFEAFTELYGATRQRLENALLEQPGWDVVHLSGHGLAGALMLEDDAGRPDRIPSAELVELLGYTSEQLKLVTLSACESAAVTAAEHLHLLGLQPAVRDKLPDQRSGEHVPPGVAGGRHRDQPDSHRVQPDSHRVQPDSHRVQQDSHRVQQDRHRGQPDSDDASPTDTTPAMSGLPAIAAQIVNQLDCAVLAMRYPVVDDFAIDLTRSFYDLLLGRGNPAPRALALSLPRAAAQPPTPAAPALSIGTPTLFGARAAQLTLQPPPGEPAVFDLERQRLARFPSQPERFVGRVGPMTRAATALAPNSGRTGVLFHGMAGAGKTACALELAYSHQDSFPLIAWHRAPDQGHDISPALVDFAFALEHQLPGLRLAHVVNDTAALQQILPGLTKALEHHRALIVLDNIESLLTGDGRWRDERWGLLIAAMTRHRGLSRLVLTSRTMVDGLADSVLVEAVHALSLPESVLLARELPNLAALIDAKPPLPAGLTAEQAQGLAARVLAVVQGHPKLIELAEGQAADPAVLAVRLAQADQVWLARGARLAPFLAGADPAPTAAEYLSVLQGWTRATTTTLPPDAVLLLEFLSGVEEDDRVRRVLDGSWADVWRRLGRTGAPPDPEPLLAVLIARALIAPDTDPDSGVVLGWRMHPGVAETTRAATDPVVAVAVDTELGEFWLATLDHALRGEQDGELGWLVLRAARSAAPYLLRRHRWPHLDHAAEQLLRRDESTAAAALLPMLQAAVSATHDNPDLNLDLGRTHARALIRLQPERGAARLRELLATATTGQRWVAAGNLTGDLINHLQVRGRLGEALALADTLPGYTRRAGHGPWTQLLDQAVRLQILRAQGQHQQVLQQVLALWERMVELPDPPESTDTTVTPWNVREILLQTGVFAAGDLGDWQQALDLNAEIHTSKRRRGASPAEQARTRFDDYGPLLRLGRVEQARDLLIDCRAVFEASNHIPLLGRTLGALAQAEAELGHLPRAIELVTDALRYKYLAGDPSAIATSHHNLAGYLRRDGRDPRLVWAHHLAAAVIYYQTGDGTLTISLRNLAGLLNTDPDTAPGSFAEVCTLVEQTDGVHLTRLLDQLPHRAPDPHAAMTEVLRQASQAATTAQADQAARLTT